MAWLPDGCEDMFIPFDRLDERDTHTHTHTDGRTDRHRMTAKAALDASIARQKLHAYSKVNDIKYWK